MYDYDRRDEEGNLRELDLKKAIDVTTVPHQEIVNMYKVEECEHVQIITLVESDFFTVYKWDVQGKGTFSLHERYILLSVIKGSGTLIHEKEFNGIEKGMHFIMPVGSEVFEIEGVCELIVSHT